MSKLHKLLIIVFLFSAITLKLAAQETTAEVAGTVTQDSGVIAGATVTVLNTTTGTKSVTVTRKDGRYNVAGLRVGGPYTITVDFVGFKQEKQENINLLLGQQYRADFSLTASSNNLNEVVVQTTQQGKVFSTNHTGVQEIIGRNQIEKLPTVNRSLNDFVKLTPSANGLSFGGGSSAYNNVTLDGANFTNSFGLGTVGGILGAQTNQTPISLDAIEQLQVNISPFDVRTGGFAGTGINAVTRGGTNQFKGSAYAYKKWPGTQGYHVEDATLPEQAFNFHLYGASLGGPIIKNKVFFFANYEQVRQTAPATVFTAATAASPAVTGVVSQANADTLNTLAAFLKSKFNYDPGKYQGYSYNTQSDKITARIDWNVNDKNTITLKYNYFKSEADQPPSSSGPSVPAGYTSVSRTPGNNSLPFSSAGYGINNNFNIVIAELNTRFSNKASNKFQVGYTAIRDPRSSPSSVFPMVDILSLNPSVGTATTSFGYEQFTYGNIVKTDIFQFSDIFTLYKGAHEITLGTQNYFKKYADGFAPQFAGLYQFATVQDFYNAVNNNTFAKFYTNEYSAVQGEAFPYSKSGANELSFFAQDKWHVSTNFTLLYGFRLDERIFNGLFLDNPNFDALTFGGKSYRTDEKPKNNFAFSPRIGFNWDVSKDRSLQIRGGIGLFSGPPPYVWLNNQSANNGVLFGQTVSLNGTVFNQTVSTTPPTSVTIPNTYVVNLTDPGFKYPSVLKSTFAIDKKLPGDVILTLEGTYSKDINAIYFQNLNLDETKGFALTGTDTRTRFGTPNNFYPGVDTVSAVNPKLSSVILMTNTNKGYSYTATVQLQKALKNWFFSAAYTRSVAKNVNELGTTAASLWGGRTVSDDPNSNELGYASYYQPHRVIATISYRKEYAKYFATSFGLLFEAAPSGTTSYIYSGDLNNDGNTSNDLMYIPASAADINLIDAGSYNAATHSGTTTGTATDPRTSAQIWSQLNNYISQDHYLAFHRGTYATRNAVVYPIYKRVDLNITQDIYFFTKNNANQKDKHTLRFTLDVINAGNFLNRNWGLYKTPSLTVNNGIQLLKFEGMAADNTTPLFSMPYLDSKNLVPVTSTFTNATNITQTFLSRWQMQFGIRYLFN